MSYILDALKKAEKDRQRGAAPDVLTVQDSVAERPKRRRLLPYLLAAALLLNGGIFAWLLNPWHEKEKDIDSPAPVTQQQAVSAEKILDPLPAGKEITALPKSSEKASIHENVAARDLPIPKVDTAKTSPATRPAAVSGQNRVMPAESSAEPQPPVQGNVISDRRVLALKELPEPVRQGLPNISLSVHYYDSNPALRMVSINNRTVREGQEFAPGLRLEEIVPDGAVFSFQGYRIHIGLSK